MPAAIVGCVSLKSVNPFVLPAMLASYRNQPVTKYFKADLPNAGGNAKLCP